MEAGEITSLINGATIAVGTILGYSAMAGTIGGGGLEDIAIRYGYHRYQADIMIVTVVLLVILGTDFPDGRNHSGQPTGQEKIVIKKII